jgi:hypothetical protein
MYGTLDVISTFISIEAWDFPPPFVVLKQGLLILEF